MQRWTDDMKIGTKPNNFENINGAAEDMLEWRQDPGMSTFCNRK